MATPFPSRPAERTRSQTRGTPTRPGDWRCRCCGKRLGLCHPDHVHLRFSRGREYLVGYPVIATCHGCGMLNRCGGDHGPDGGPDRAA